MKLEIEIAATFFGGCLLLNGLSKETADAYSRELASVMQESYSSCWYPESSIRGSGNRCVRVHPFKVDPLLVRAGNKCGLKLTELRECLPSELVMWVDPAEVSVRIGHERAPIQHLFENGQRREVKEFSRCRSPESRPSASSSTRASVDSPETYRIGTSHVANPANSQVSPVRMWQPPMHNYMMSWQDDHSRLQRESFAMYSTDNWVH